MGTLLLVSKLFDGVTDLFAGYLIDNTHTRFGKARPYEFANYRRMALYMAAVQLPSQWSYAVKAVWVFIIYSFCQFHSRNAVEYQSDNIHCTRLS